MTVNAPEPGELASEFLDRQILMLDKMGVLGGSPLETTAAAFIAGMRKAAKILEYYELFQRRT